MHIIIMPPQAIMQGMPMAIMAIMRSQASVNAGMAMPPIGIILQTMPSAVISQVMLAIIIGIIIICGIIMLGIMPGIILGIIMFGIMPGIIICGIMLGIIGIAVAVFMGSGLFGSMRRPAAACNLTGA